MNPAKDTMKSLVGDIIMLMVQSLWENDFGLLHSKNLQKRNSLIRFLLMTTSMQMMRERNVPQVTLKEGRRSCAGAGDEVRLKLLEKLKILWRHC
jgi:hypothetical protein